MTELIGTVIGFDNGFWRVAYGPKVVDVELLRLHQFHFPPKVGMKVKMRYVTTFHTGMWHVYEEITS